MREEKGSRMCIMGRQFSKYFIDWTNALPCLGVGGWVFVCVFVVFMWVVVCV